MSISWSDLPVWDFCQVDTTVPTIQRYTVKVVESSEPPAVGEKVKDGPLVVRVLVNQQSNKLVGYSFTFRRSPTIRDFGYSLAASYGLPDSDDMLVVLGSPHVRVLRAGNECPVYHVVLRHK